MDRNLALEFVRVTEAAAIAAAKWVGKGEAKLADGAAVDQMRARFNQIDFAGTVVIGEGSKDEAPELYNGEKVGTGKGPKMDLAIDPLECTDSVAYGRYTGGPCHSYRCRKSTALRCLLGLCSPQMSDDSARHMHN